MRFEKVLDQQAQENQLNIFFFFFIIVSFHLGGRTTYGGGRDIGSTSSPGSSVRKEAVCFRTSKIHLFFFLPAPNTLLSKLNVMLDVDLLVCLEGILATEAAPSPSVRKIVIFLPAS